VSSRTHLIEALLLLLFILLILFLFNFYFFLPCLIFDGRFGVLVGILAYYARGRGFDSRTVQTFVCMNMTVCIGSGCFYVQYVFTKKMYISIYPLDVENFLIC
jgi:hypothetical protein